VAKKRVIDPRTGKAVEGDEVKIERVEDQPIFVHLVDGSILRLKIDVAEVIKIPGHDREGHPLYNVKHAGLLSVAESPDDLKKQ
jgi:hypothetical protein